MSRHPIVTLTSDFGVSGFYVGAMKGVLLSLCPDATLVDLSHRVTPFAPLEASLVLSQAVPSFPEGSVHLAVVDPGVGGLRRAIVVGWRGHFLVGPDNGIFTPFLEDAEQIYRIHDRIALPGSSQTFHGRDLFAPAAARLARGDDPSTVGEPTVQAVRLHLPRPRSDGLQVLGQILYADRFGNLISNIHRDDVAGLPADLETVVGTYTIPRLSRTYSEGTVGECVALFGSTGHLEVAVVQGHAAGQLGMGKGERIRVRARSGS